VWPGDPAKANPADVPEAFGLDNPDWVMRSGGMDYEADYQLLIDIRRLMWSDTSASTRLNSSSRPTKRWTGTDGYLGFVTQSH
jgi:hypothetical protein